MRLGRVKFLAQTLAHSNSANQCWQKRLVLQRLIDKLKFVGPLNYL